MEVVVFQICKALKTRSSVVVLLGYLDSLTTSRFTLDSAGALALPGSELDLWGVSNYSSEELRQLRAELLHVPTVSLSLSFQPSGHFITAVYTLLETHLPAPFLLDITTDLTLDFGATVSWEGRYTEVSVKSRILSYLEEHNV